MSALDEGKLSLISANSYQEAQQGVSSESVARNQSWKYRTAKIRARNAGKNSMSILFGRYRFNVSESIAVILHVVNQNERLRWRRVAPRD